MNNSKLKTAYVFPDIYKTLNNYTERVLRILFKIDKNILVFNDYFYILPYKKIDNYIVFNTWYNIRFLGVFENIYSCLNTNELNSFLNNINLDNETKESLKYLTDGKYYDVCNKDYFYDKDNIIFNDILSKIKYTNNKCFKKDLYIFNTVFLCFPYRYNRYKFYYYFYNHLNDTILINFKVKNK